MMAEATQRLRFQEKTAGVKPAATILSIELWNNVVV